MVKSTVKTDCVHMQGNACPAVDGRDKICEDCDCIEEVVQYKLFYARVVSEEIKAIYNKYGLKAFKEIVDEDQASLDDW